MKRRGFLSLLGLAPAAPLIAKELARQVEAVPLAAETTLHSLAPTDPVTVRYEPRGFAQMCTAGYITTLSAVPHSPSVWRLK